jgi:antitoxin component of RelBE/YafQ-DinJ toxin-antitoxin module
MTVQTAYLIDANLKRAFKTLCANRGVSMSEEINNFIRTTVERNPLGDSFFKETKVAKTQGNPKKDRDWRDELTTARWEDTY